MMESTSQWPCSICIRVNDPPNCENKLCREWQEWFVQRWNAMRSNPWPNASMPVKQERPFELKRCPFCHEDAVFIGVHDDEGNFHGLLGCDYESKPWSGLSYALHHEGWGECILCSDGANEVMGGVLFDTAEEAAEAWNGGVE